MSGSPENCHVCGKPRQDGYRPFCSKRCADIDLGRWLKGDYAIPGVESDPGDTGPVRQPSNDDEVG